MRHLRFNIAGALGAILFVAVGFAALREADELWDSWLFSLTLGLLLVAVLLAIDRTGARRPFWIGFALFGWGFDSLPDPVNRAQADHHQGAIVSSEIENIPIRVYRWRAILDRDRMRPQHLGRRRQQGGDTGSSSMIDSPGRVIMDSPRLVVQPTDPTSQTIEFIRPGPRYNNLEQYANIILKATADGEILRIKDIGRVELGPSYYIPRIGAGAEEHFIHIGHTLFTLQRLASGVFRRLGSVSGNARVEAEDMPYNSQSGSRRCYSRTGKASARRLHFAVHGKLRRAEGKHAPLWRRVIDTPHGAVGSLAGWGRERTPRSRLQGEPRNS